MEGALVYKDGYDARTLEIDPREIDSKQAFNLAQKYAPKQQFFKTIYFEKHILPKQDHFDKFIQHLKTISTLGYQKHTFFLMFAIFDTLSKYIA